MKPFIAGMVLLLAFCLESPAFACSCRDVATFSEVMEGSPIVMVARVSAVGQSHPTDDDPASVDLDLLWSTKGTTRQRVRVWNTSVRSSCGGHFRSTPVGTRMVVALVPVVHARLADADWAARDGMRASDSDFVLARSACAQTYLELTTAAELAEWMGKTVK
jgi:hypothetical protein